VRGIVSDRKVSAYAFEHELRARRHGIGETRRVLGRATHTVHPGVDLEVHGQWLGTTGLGDSSGQRIDAVRRVDDRRQSVRNDRRSCNRGLLREHEHRRADARVAQCNALFHERHTEPARAGLERSFGDRHRAVAVAICFHDREQCSR